MTSDFLKTAGISQILLHGIVLAADQKDIQYKSATQGWFHLYSCRSHKKIFMHDPVLNPVQNIS